MIYKIYKKYGNMFVLYKLYIYTQLQQTTARHYCDVGITLSTA